MQKKFEIKKYHGLKNVKSLPVYPISLHGRTDEIMSRDYFIRRGRKFIDLAGTKAAVVHKRYNGLAFDLNELPEEVCGPSSLGSLQLTDALGEL